MMKIKKLLLGVTALSGLLAANTLLAAPLGTGTTITTAKVVCMSTLVGDVPLYTVTGAGQQKGIESSWLVTNTSPTETLAITQVDSYDINGNLLVSVTPTSPATTGIPAGADLPVASGGLFSWTLHPYQVSRFPHDFAMIYPNATTGITGTDPSLVHWHSVVITLGNATPGMEISAPVVAAAMVERGEYTVPPSFPVGAAPVSGQTPVLTRTRNECAYMM